MRRLGVIHPLLFALFPVLFLYSHNIDQVAFSDIGLPLTVTGGGALLAWVLLSLLLRDARKAGLLVSLFVLIVFSYGPVREQLAAALGDEMLLARHRFLMPVCGVLWVLGTYWTVRTRRSLLDITAILNVAAAVLVALSRFSTKCEQQLWITRIRRQPEAMCLLPGRQQQQTKRTCRTFTT